MTTATMERSVLDQLDHIATDGPAKYQQLAISLAEGNHHSNEEIAHTLLIAGKTIEQLKADVSKLQQRIQAFKELDEADSITADVPKYQELRQRLEAEIAEVQREYAAIRLRFEQKLDGLKSQHTQAGDAINAMVQQKAQTISNATRLLERTQSKSIFVELQKLKDATPKGPDLPWNGIDHGKSYTPSDQLAQLIAEAEAALKAAESKSVSFSGREYDVMVAKTRLHHLKQMVRPTQQYEAEVEAARPALLAHLEKIKAMEAEIQAKLLDWRTIDFS